MSTYDLGVHPFPPALILKGSPDHQETTDTCATEKELLSFSIPSLPAQSMDALKTISGIVNIPAVNAAGYPDNNPKTAFGMAKTPLDLIPPEMLNHVARAFANGAAKYGPYNWRTAKISSSVYYAAAMRHLTAWWEREEVAPDSGVHHLGHVGACLAMILDTQHSDLLNDNRPPRVERKT